MDTFTWVIDGATYETERLPDRCSMCGAPAIVALPPPLLAKQPDDTTHVCAPFLGGCNHGFHFDSQSPEQKRAKAIDDMRDPAKRRAFYAKMHKKTLKP